MKPRHRRLLLILAGLAVLGAILALILNAFHGNLVFFFSPSEVAAGHAPKERTFRVGGVVKEGSLRREADGVTLTFVVTDTEKELVVRYQGILPDLFREGKGAVAQGRIGGDGVFAATQVLAKHDENYTPPEVAQAVDEAQKRKAIEATAKTLKQ
ncbi:MAG: cytochrome c maturation protein CcmE [Candidatus Accumulibacter sp.]|jgi:cytochrome c-type biogenesis protein CcmE|nr:cytochrome c maturation protein CcmE [Accumulibacter sp.]